MEEDRKRGKKVQGNVELAEIEKTGITRAL